MWKNRYVFSKSFEKNINSTVSFRERILLPKIHTCAWQYIRTSCCGAVLACGRSGLWPFRSVAIPVCGHFGLWPFRCVALSVCGRFSLYLSGLWPFRSVALPVCGRFGLWPFRLWPFRFVAVMTCYRYEECVLCDLRLPISTNHV